MRYIDLLKLYIEGAVWIYAVIIICLAIGCYFQSIQTIDIPIWVISRIISMIIILSLGHWYFDLSKK